MLKARDKRGRRVERNKSTRIALRVTRRRRARPSRAAVARQQSANTRDGHARDQVHDLEKLKSLEATKLLIVHMKNILAVRRPVLAVPLVVVLVSNTQFFNKIILVVVIITAAATATAVGLRRKHRRPMALLSQSEVDTPTSLAVTRTRKAVIPAIMVTNFTMTTN